jgi:hypothetical protein
MSKYDGLVKFLSRRTSPVRLSFREIDSAVDGGLPACAYEDRTWWGNSSNPRRVQSKVWMKAGWATSEVSMDKRTLTFSHR